MRVGIYAGGFKPFTTGHYSKLLYSCGGDGVCEKNDVVILFYGMAGRKKGSGYTFSPEMSHAIFDIMKVAIERELSKDVEAHVIKSFPQPPVAYTFSAIADFARVPHPPTFSFSNIGIDPEKIETLTIYGDDEALGHYIEKIGARSEDGTDLEAKYFGDTAKTGRLLFDAGYDEQDSTLSAPDERVIKMFMAKHPSLSREEAEDKVRVRGSDVRAAIMSRDPDAISRYLPEFLTDEERSQIIEILIQGIPAEESQMSESLIRYMIRGFLVN